MRTTTRKPRSYGRQTVVANRLSAVWRRQLQKLLLATVAVSFASPVLADPKPGDRFEINSKVPKYYGIFFVMDAEGDAWPSYCYGKPLDGGHWVYDDVQHQGEFELQFERIAQNSGDQSRRILGETIVDGQTSVRFKLVSLGKSRPIKIDFEDSYRPVRPSKKYPDGIKEVTRTPAVLEMTVRDVTTRVDAELRIKSGGKTSIKIDSFFSINGSDIGLKKHPGKLNCRLWFKAFPPRS